MVGRWVEPQACGSFLSACLVSLGLYSSWGLVLHGDVGPLSMLHPACSWPLPTLKTALHMGGNPRAVMPKHCQDRSLACPAAHWANPEAHMGGLKGAGWKDG